MQRHFETPIVRSPLTGGLPTWTHGLSGLLSPMRAGLVTWDLRTTSEEYVYLQPLGIVTPTSIRQNTAQLTGCNVGLIDPPAVIPEYSKQLSILNKAEE